MPHLFVYGSLKQSFVNQHVNTGRRMPGRFRTQDKFGLYLLGEGEVPCLVFPPGQGHQVIGELYEITDADIQRMDRLERLGDPDGYERVKISVERFDTPAPEIFTTFVYLKQHCNIPAATPRIGPLDEYRLEHTVRFSWLGTD